MRNLSVSLAFAVVSIALASSADAAVKIDSATTIVSKVETAQGYKPLRDTSVIISNLGIGGTFAAGRFDAGNDLSSAELEVSRSGNVDFSHAYATPGAPDQLYSGFIADKFTPMSFIRTLPGKGKNSQFEGRSRFGKPVVGLEAVPEQASAVPEPATWAMLLLGFLAVGASMRRKRDLDAERRAKSGLVTMRSQLP